MDLGHVTAYVLLDPLQEGLGSRGPPRAHQAQGQLGHDGQRLVPVPRLDESLRETQASPRIPAAAPEARLQRDVGLLSHVPLRGQVDGAHDAGCGARGAAQERGVQRVAHPGMGSGERVELVLAQLEQLRGDRRGDSRRSPPAGDRGDLAEEVVLAQLGDLHVPSGWASNEDLHAAAAEDIEAVALLALGHEDVARLVASQRRRRLRTAISSNSERSAKIGDRSR